jgi:hypothetical protein
MVQQAYSYFGNIHEIETFIKEGEVCFIKNSPFTKMSFKNRMVIATAQGALHLTIPIQGGRDQKTAMNCLKISYDTPWREQHLKAINSSYKRAPFFEHYEALIEALYTSHPIFLIDFLEQCHQSIRMQLKNSWTVIEENNPSATDAILTQRVSPKNYHLMANHIKYQQVFEDRIGFLPNLSILDLLFCVGGKQAVQILKTS